MRDKRSLVLLLGAVAFALLPLLVTLGCASVGTGRVDVVRAEDTLVNSLTVYEAVMELHYAVSVHETPDIYAAVEDVRVTFPKAYRVAKSAVRAYKAGRAKDFGTALDELEDALDKLRELLPKLKSAKAPTQGWMLYDGTPPLGTLPLGLHLPFTQLSCTLCTAAPYQSIPLGSAFAVYDLAGREVGR